MNLITTTELRTKTSDLVEKLLKGEEVELIHRSKVVAVIKPKKVSQSKRIDPKRFAMTLKKLEPKRKMTYKQIMKIYDHYMMYRHGPRVS